MMERCEAVRDAYYMGKGGPLCFIIPVDFVVEKLMARVPCVLFHAIVAAVDFYCLRGDLFSFFLFFRWMGLVMVQLEVFVS